MFMKTLRLIIPVALLLSACSHTGTEVSSAPESDTPTIGMPVPGAEGVDEMIVTEDAGGDGDAADAPKGGGEAAMRSVHIDVTDWAFTPKVITVKRGEKVTLELTGVSGMHGVSIPDLGVQSAKFGPGETVSVAVPTDKTGTFSFRCNVPCGSGHKEMTGTIVIED